MKNVQFDINNYLEEPLIDPSQQQLARYLAQTTASSSSSSNSYMRLMVVDDGGKSTPVPLPTSNTGVMTLNVSPVTIGSLTHTPSTQQPLTHTPSITSLQLAPTSTYQPPLATVSSTQTTTLTMSIQGQSNQQGGQQPTSINDAFFEQMSGATDVGGGLMLI